MTTTEEFVADFVTEEWLAHRLVGVANHDGLAFVDDPAVDEAGIVVCTLTAPATCFDLHFVALVGKFE